MQCVHLTVVHMYRLSAFFLLMSLIIKTVCALKKVVPRQVQVRFVYIAVLTISELLSYESACDFMTIHRFLYRVAQPVYTQLRTSY